MKEDVCLFLCAICHRKSRIAFFGLRIQRRWNEKFLRKPEDEKRKESGYDQAGAERWPEAEANGGRAPVVHLERQEEIRDSRKDSTGHRRLPVTNGRHQRVVGIENPARNGTGGWRKRHQLRRLRRFLLLAPEENEEPNCPTCNCGKEVHFGRKTLKCTKCAPQVICIRFFTPPESIVKAERRPFFSEKIEKTLKIFQIIEKIKKERISNRLLLV